MVFALDDHDGVALEHDEDLLLVAIDLVVLGDRIALLDLDDVQAERADVQPAADELPAPILLEFAELPDRESVRGHRVRRLTQGQAPRACPWVRSEPRPG